MTRERSVSVGTHSTVVATGGLKGVGFFLILFALSLGACRQDPIASEDVGSAADKRSGGSAAANPVLVYEGRESYRGGRYSTIAVMDSTGENQTDVVFSRDFGERQSLQWPDWSPDGKSICFRQSNNDVTAPVDYIRTFDLSLSSTGKPIASSTRIIYSSANGDGVNSGLAWSKTSAVNRIAFTTYNQNNPIGSLWTIPASGGTPQRVWGVDSVYYMKEDGIPAAKIPLTCPTWSPDDSRLAVVRNDSAQTAGTERVNTIMIFSTTDGGSTWSYTDSIKLTGTGYSASMLAHGLEWSRNANGVDMLVWSDHQSSTIYYCSPTTGATPTTDGVWGRYPDWSPDNGTIIFHNSETGRIARMPAFGTDITDITGVPGLPLVRWK